MNSEFLRRINLIFVHEWLDWRDSVGIHSSRFGDPDFSVGAGKWKTLDNLKHLNIRIK